MKLFKCYQHLWNKDALIFRPPIAYKMSSEDCYLAICLWKQDRAIKDYNGNLDLDYSYVSEVDLKLFDIKSDYPILTSLDEFKPTVFL